MATKSNDIANITREFNKIQKYVVAKQISVSTGIQKDAYKVGQALVSEAQKTIRAYNKGKLERYPGDLAERASRGYKNNPLKNTGIMSNAISMNVEKEGQITAVKVIFNSYYARFLNDGTNHIAPYRFREIAMVMAEDKINKILGVK